MIYILMTFDSLLGPSHTNIELFDSRDKLEKKFLDTVEEIGKTKLNANERASLLEDGEYWDDEGEAYVAMLESRVS